MKLYSISQTIKKAKRSSDNYNEKYQQETLSFENVCTTKIASEGISVFSNRSHALPITARVNEAYEGNAYGMMMFAIPVHQSN